MPTRADYREHKQQQQKKRIVKKSAIIIGVFAIALGMYAGNLQYQAQVAAKEEQADKRAEENSTAGRARIAQAAVKALYVAENSSFLNEKISLEEIKRVQKKVDRVRQKDLRLQLNEIVGAVAKMYTLQSELNAHFTKPAISGDEVSASDELVIAQYTKMDTLVTLNKELANFNNTQWYTAMKAVVEMGMKQARATEQLAETLENEPELVTLVERRANYKEAVALLEKVKNKAVRQTYHIQLVKLNKRLLVDEEQERLRLAEAAKLAAEAAEKAAREEAKIQAENEKLAREVAAEKAVSEAAEKAAQEQAASASAEKNAQEQAATKKAAQEKAASAAAKKAAAEKAASEAAKKAAAEKAASEAAKKAAAEKAASEAAKKAAAEKAASEAAKKAAAEKAASEAAKKAAAEKAANEAAKKDK